MWQQHYQTTKICIGRNKEKKFLAVKVYLKGKINRNVNWQGQKKPAKVE